MRYIWGETFWSNEAGNATTDPNASSAHAFMLGAVPPGEVWQLRTLSLSTDDGRSMEYFIEALVNVPPTPGHHYHRIAGGWGAGTPALHVPPEDLQAMPLLPGERLAARANPPSVPMNGRGIKLLWSGWAYPESELPRLRGMGATGASAPPPDFSAVITAAQNFVQALQDVP